MVSRKEVIETSVNRNLVRTAVAYLGKSSPMILLCNGFPGDQKNEDLLSEFSRRGISTARINYRGTGDSEGSFSFSGASYEIGRIYQDLRERFPHAPERFALAGYSYGGLFSVNVIRDSPEIKNLICISPVVDLKRFLHENDMGAFFSESTKKVRGNPQQWQYEQHELLSMMNPVNRYIFLDPSALIQNGDYRRPIPGMLQGKTMIEHLNLENLFVVHGSKDRDVSVEHGKTLYSLAKARKTLKVIDGADHSYSNPEHRRQMIKATVEYAAGVLN